MLILSRKQDERILIGANVDVVIIETGSHCCRIGIDASPLIPVVRDDARRCESVPPLVPLPLVTSAITQCAVEGIAKVDAVSRVLQILGEKLGTSARPDGLATRPAELATRPAAVESVRL